MMSNIDKSYIQCSKYNEEIQDTFLKQEKGKNYKALFSKKPQISFSNYLIKEETLQSNKWITISKSLELLEPNLETESEIKEASLYLEEMKKENRIIEFSENIWNYSKNLLLDISKRYWNQLGKTLPKPKFNFIDEHVEIRWVLKDFKLILSISDEIDDIVIYSKTKSGRYINGTIPKNEILDWVLNQFQIC